MMKIFHLFLIAFFIAVVSCGPTVFKNNTCSKEIARNGLIDAVTKFSSGDVDGALEYFDENVYIQFPGSGGIPTVGKATNKVVWQALYNSGLRLMISPSDINVFCMNGQAYYMQIRLFYKMSLGMFIPTSGHVVGIASDPHNFSVNAGGFGVN